MKKQDFSIEDLHSTSALAKKKSRPALDSIGNNKPATPKLRMKHTPL